MKKIKLTYNHTHNPTIAIFNNKKPTNEDILYMQFSILFLKYKII